MQICFNEEIKILRLHLRKPCLLCQQPQTAAQRNPAPKPEHLWPPCHVYRMAAPTFSILLSVPRELVEVKVEDRFYGMVTVFLKQDGAD